MDNRDASVLLTGGTGFVGRHLRDQLRERGCRVRLVLRQQPDRQLAPPLSPNESVCVTEDLFAETSAWWTEACRDVDMILHAAWFVQPGAYLHSPRNLACLSGTLQMAKGAVAAGVGRFVGIGTCFEYDLEAGVLSAQTPLRPATLYGAAKASTYLTLQAYLDTQDVAFAWCRLFYLHGEGEASGRLVPHVRSCLEQGVCVELTSGTQVRDYLDVQDAARKILDVALEGGTGAFNICSGVPVTVRALVEGIADGYGRRDLLRFGARPDPCGDPPCVVGVPMQGQRVDPPGGG